MHAAVLEGQQLEPGGGGQGRGVPRSEAVVCKVLRRQGVGRRRQVSADGYLGKATLPSASQQKAAATGQHAGHRSVNQAGSLRSHQAFEVLQVRSGWQRLHQKKGEEG